MSRLEKRLLAEVARASGDHGLIEPNDRIMVAVSGGKDSHALLRLLLLLRARAPFPFSVVAVNLDQKQPGFPADTLPRYFRELGVEHRIVEEDTYSIVKEKVPEGRTYCALCSRLRRGILYNVAQELGATKLALGHHRDDAVETLLLNLFYSGQIKAMPPRLLSDDGRNVVIRPLITSSEADIAAYAAEQGFPIVPCNLCGSQENLHRVKIKELIAKLSAENPAVAGNLFAALSNVRPTHLHDRGLLARLGLGAPQPAGGAAPSLAEALGEAPQAGTPLDVATTAVVATEVSDAALVPADRLRARGAALTPPEVRPALPVTAPRS